MSKNAHGILVAGIFSKVVGYFNRLNEFLDKNKQNLYSVSEEFL
jgi:hypothetical protein